MHPEQRRAEDSCLKHQLNSQDVGVVAVPDVSVRDIEKAEVRDDASVAGRAVTESQDKQTSDGNGVLETVHPESDNSSVTAFEGIDEKDDFPEGGLRG